MNLNNVLIGSEQPGALVAYYTRIFGKPEYEGEGYASWQIGSGYLNVGPHDQVKGKNPAPGRLIVNIESADVKGAYEKFKAAGAIVIREPYKFEMGGDAQGSDVWIATFADPDDNYFQLTSPFTGM